MLCSNTKGYVGKYVCSDGAPSGGSDDDGGTGDDGGSDDGGTLYSDDMRNNLGEPFWGPALENHCQSKWMRAARYE